MKININSINNILYTFYEKEMLNKYASIWQSRGETEISITAKSFGITIAAKMILQGNIADKFPMLLAITDEQGNIDIDNVKNIILESIKEFKEKGKKIIIPTLQWELDEEDINKIYEIATQYKIDKE